MTLKLAKKKNFVLAVVVVVVVVCFFYGGERVICVMILLSGGGGGGGGGGDVGSGESQVPKASLPSRITSSFVRHIPGRRKYDSRAARKIFTFFN